MRGHHHDPRPREHARGSAGHPRKSHPRSALSPLARCISKNSGRGPDPTAEERGALPRFSAVDNRIACSSVSTHLGEQLSPMKDEDRRRHPHCRPASNSCGTSRYETMMAGRSVAPRLKNRNGSATWRALEQKHAFGSPSHVPPPCTGESSRDCRRRPKPGELLNSMGSRGRARNASDGGGALIYPYITPERPTRGGPRARA